SHPTPPTPIYTLSLHDALPISRRRGAPAEPFPLHPGRRVPRHERRAVRAAATSRRATSQHHRGGGRRSVDLRLARWDASQLRSRSEEHTSELQSLAYLVCRLLL